MSISRTTSPLPEADPPPQPAGLLRRLAAVVYDSLILFALIFIATFLLMQILGGEIAASDRWILQVSALLVAYLYFGWFWTHGGQTVGMRAWRFRVVDNRYDALGWRLATLRFLFAMVSWLALGLGFLWAAWDPERRAWHDRWSQSRLVRTRSHSDR